MTTTVPRRPRPGRRVALRDRRRAGSPSCVTTPLVPADYLDLSTRCAPAPTCAAGSWRSSPRPRDAATLVIQPGRGWAGHVPGQYVRIGVDVDGVRHWRAYSLTYGPPRRRLHQRHRQGDPGRRGQQPPRAPRAGPARSSSSTRPRATSSCRAGARPRLLFVTAGCGITPVMGMLRNRSRDDGSTDVVAGALGAHRRATSIFGDELRALAAAGRIRLVERHTDDRRHARRRRPRRRSCPTSPSADLGLRPGRAARRARGALRRRAASPLHTERFRPTVVVTGEGGTVTFAEPAPRVEADGATPLLDAGEEAGVLMPSGCRMGICFGCVLPLREGAVRDLRNGDITTAARRRRRPRSRPASTPPPAPATSTTDP